MPNRFIFMMKLLFKSFLQKILKLKELLEDTSGKVRNHKKATEWPEFNSLKKVAGKHF